MQDDKQKEENLDQAELDTEKFLREDLDKQIDEFIRNNPDMDENEIDELKKVADKLLEQKLNQTTKGYLFRRMLISILIYILVGLVTFGFFFTTISISPRWLIFVVVGIISLAMSLLDTLIVYINDKRGVVGINVLTLICPLICAVIGYFINSSVLLVFSYHFIFPIIIILIFIFKAIIRFYLYKYIPKLRRSL